MKKFINWQVLWGIVLVLLSASVYFIHYLIFRDLHHIFLYLIGDIAFVFLEVLIVTIVIHKLLVYREKQAMLNKLNMVIGAFFSEVGTSLLRKFVAFQDEGDDANSGLIVSNEWSKKEFLKKHQQFEKKNFLVDCKNSNLNDLKEFLIVKRQFMLNLLANPNLLEHDAFTNCLWAVLHLTEELLFRNNLDDLPDADNNHLSGDIKRAYKQLIGQWLSYMSHLKIFYPYLFSLAIRTNPFDKNADIVVK